MPESRRGSMTPWIIAGVSGVLLIGLIFVYFAFLLPYRRDHSPGEFTSTEKQAMAAAGTDAVNALSFRRAHFDADFQRALASATGSLRTDIEAKRSATEKALTTGKFDLSAKITHTALGGPADKKSVGKGYVVLLTVNGYKSNSPTVPTQQSLQVTVVNVKGKWLLTDVANIGIS